MPSVGAEFRQLHELHVQLKEIQDQLARGPKQIKARQVRIEVNQQAQATREADVKEARTTIDKKNLDLRTKETHLADLQAKLNAAASNREFDIIRGQMDADRAAKAVLEDEILEWLERLDACQKTVVVAKHSVQESQHDAQRVASDFEVKIVDLQRQEADLKTRIAEVEKIIPAEVKPQYRRLVEAYGAESLASADGGVCNFCNVSITSQQRVLLNGGKLLFCSTCGRLIYPPERG